MVEERRMRNVRQLLAKAPQITKRMTLEGKELPIEITFLVVSDQKVRVIVTLNPHTLYSYNVFDSYIDSVWHCEVISFDICQMKVRFVLNEDTFFVELSRRWWRQPERLLIVTRYDDEETSGYRIDTFGKWSCYKH